LLASNGRIELESRGSGMSDGAIEVNQGASLNAIRKRKP
jgi:hypothetical protein